MLELLENFSDNFQSAMSFFRFGWFHGMPYVKDILEFLVMEKNGQQWGSIPSKSDGTPTGMVGKCLQLKGK